MPPRHSAHDLISFSTALLQGSGLDPDKAAVVAEILVEGDLLGHSTHGLNLLPLYLDELEHDRMTKSGSPSVLADRPAAVTWDGRLLPGPWLVVRALDLAVERARLGGTGTVVVRRSHHTACLAAYLRRATDQDMVVILTCSDPHASVVAPHGGRRGVYSPNPVAAAWPTDGDPVMLDTSMSIASHGVTRRHFEEHRPLPGAWVIDADGNPSDDPGVFFSDPPGALLPIGGTDHGYKGYALGLLVEAITAGLAGHGRADLVKEWSSTVCIQVFEPAAFGGRDAFINETSWLARACRDTPPRSGFDHVRLPGEAAWRRRVQQLRDGVDLRPETMPALATWAEKYRVPVPRAVA